MSEPKRYDLVDKHYGYFLCHKIEGEWVKWEDYARLKAEVERLTADLNKMTKTPEGVDYVEVDVGFWTKSGSRLPSSYRTFWSNDKGVQS
jgi:hypothetical protein